ncbi:7490_t:CDS:2 [Acaulospora morrowiae]|uniref:7490_t:CDS:1 n=1 Tax=Acaulospora morrowiae TaxID=94023 RepID=A0A9N8YT97_9GLOM|nr:7490_t:CDS:2 [Acaulospora morrowiae]
MRKSFVNMNLGEGAMPSRPEISPPIQIRREYNWVDDLKVKGERMLIHAEKMYANYHAFTMEHPFLGLFLAIFIVFSAIPLFCFSIFSIFTTIITMGSALCTGALMWGFMIGGAGLLLLAALFFAFFLTCFSFFWISVALFVTNLLSRKLNEHQHLPNTKGIDLSKYGLSIFGNPTNGGDDGGNTASGEATRNSKVE